METELEMEISGTQLQIGDIFKFVNKPEDVVGNYFLKRHCRIERVYFDKNGYPYARELRDKATRINMYSLKSKKVKIVGHYIPELRQFTFFQGIKIKKTATA